MIDSRSGDNGFAVRRRRFCQDCHKRFTTFERIEVVTFRVVKRDGTRVPFDQTKLRQGVERACWKRPISAGQISSLITEIVTELENGGEPEISSRAIGEAVLKRLRVIDDVAYVRFASVYRKFDNIQDFAMELAPMIEKFRRGK